VTFAIQDYEQAFELAPDNNEIKLRISNIHFNNAERQYKEKRYQVCLNFFHLNQPILIYSQESSVELTKAIDSNPSVAKYYVSRSRVKYLTEDIQGAQADIIAAILINPLEEGCIDVLPRLFTDSTLSDVLHSSLTKQVKENLLKRNVKLAIN
jgi:tetratricopeptide (TPR) repeat protein